MITWHALESSASRIYYHQRQEVGKFGRRGNVDSHNSVGKDVVARWVRHRLWQEMCCLWLRNIWVNLLNLFPFNSLTLFFFHKPHRAMDHYRMWSVLLFPQVHILGHWRLRILHPHANVDVEPHVGTNADIFTANNDDTNADTHGAADARFDVDVLEILGTLWLHAYCDPNTARITFFYWLTHCHNHRMREWQIHDGRRGRPSNRPQRKMMMLSIQRNGCPGGHARYIFRS